MWILTAGLFISQLYLGDTAGTTRPPTYGTTVPIIKTTTLYVPPTTKFPPSLNTGQRFCGGGKCYIYVANPSSFRDAGETCKVNGTKLATIENPEQQAAIQNAMKSTYVPRTWIDVKEEEGASYQWRWADGMALSAQGCYTEFSWDRSFPIKASTTNMPYLVPTWCMQACTSLNGKSYAYALVEGGNSCWCGDSPPRGTYSYACTLPCTGNSSLYCGGHGRGFVYLTNGEYGNWDHDEPLSPGTQSCGSMSQQTFLLNAHVCTKRLSYICYIPKVAYCPAVSDSQGVYLNDTIDNKCYYIGTTPLSWYNAETRCRSDAMGSGWLVRIKSERFHQFLVTSIRDLIAQQKVPQTMLWLGLAKRFFQNHYSQGIGAPDNAMPYYNFADNEPLALLWQCLMVYSSKGYNWTEQSCADQQNSVPFFCEEEIEPDLTTEATLEMTTELLLNLTSDETTETTNSTETNITLEMTTTTVTTTSTSVTSPTVSTTTTTASAITASSASTPPSSGSSAVPVVTPAAGQSTTKTQFMTVYGIIFLILCIILLIALVIVVIIFCIYAKNNNERNRVQPEYVPGYGAAHSSAYPRYDDRGHAIIPTGGRVGEDTPYDERQETHSNCSYSTQGSGFNSQSGLFIKDKAMFH